MWPFDRGDPLSPFAALDIQLPTSSNHGLKTGSAFGWRDIVGVISNEVASAPPITAFRGGALKAYGFSNGSNLNINFHVPHDYVPGTDIFVHVHWGHNGTAISGSLVCTFNTTVAKGFNQVIFPAEVTTTLTVSTPDVATIPRWMHRTDEIQLSAAAPTANQLNTNLLEPDALILMNFTTTTIPTITGGVANVPYVFSVDIHYQSSNMATVNKAPSFYI